MKQYTQEDHDAVIATMKDFFREVASRFEHAAFRDDLPGPSGQPGILEIRCSLPGTAAVRALVGADQIDLYIGEHPRRTWWEFLPKRKDPNRLIADVCKTVEKVVAGRFKGYSAYG